MRPAARYAADCTTADVAGFVAAASLVSPASSGRQNAVERPSQRHAPGPGNSHSVGCRPLAS